MKTHSQSRQKKSSSIQAKAQKQANESSILQAYKAGISQLAEDKKNVQLQENKTGLPDNLKSGVENLSGHSLDDVKVHYNSSQPASLQAHAYAQGTDIHVAPGQEKHLPHEAWHVAQQKQGRVQPTKQLKGTTNINDDAGLEKEADVMGAKAMQLKSEKTSISLQKTNSDIVQMESKVTNTGQNFIWGNTKQNSTLVGKKMEAHLDPDDKLQGESANINADQNEMMWWIKSHHDIKAHDAVKGHLLNDNVGGKALNVNLFPITKAANAVHLRTAENFVKNKVWDDQQGVYYKVEAAIGNPSTFQYEIQDWDPASKKKSGGKETGTITSDLGSPKDMSVANEDELDYEKALLTNANAVKKGRAYSPVNKVGDLDNEWSELRDISGSVKSLSYTSDNDDIAYTK